MVKESLRVDIFVLCDTALISKENKLSIIGIFDQIVTDKIPFNFPKMTLVAVIGGQPQSFHPLHLTITDPAAKDITNLDMQVTLGDSGTSNLLSEITNFPLSLTGAYKISLLEGDKEIISKQLIINKTSVRSPLVS